MLCVSTQSGQISRRVGAQSSEASAIDCWRLPKLGNHKINGMVECAVEKNKASSSSTLHVKTSAIYALDWTQRLRNVYIVQLYVHYLINNFAVGMVIVRMAIHHKIIIYAAQTAIGSSSVNQSTPGQS